MSAIQKLQIPYIKQLDEKECPICIGELNQDTMLLFNCCKKYYHESCVTDWLVTKLPMNTAIQCPHCQQFNSISIEEMRKNLFSLAQKGLRRIELIRAERERQVVIARLLEPNRERQDRNRAINDGLVATGFAFPFELFNLLRDFKTFQSVFLTNRLICIADLAGRVFCKQTWKNPIIKTIALSGIALATAFYHSPENLFDLAPIISQILFCNLDNETLLDITEVFNIHFFNKLRFLPEAED